jgi:hypothetical protein
VTARRYDIAVKWRFFRHLIQGGDPQSVYVYRWHIEARKLANAKLGIGMDGKVDTDHYLAAAGDLCRSMAYHGFDPAYAIPIDPDGELLGGAHRVACALALGIETVPVDRRADRVWAPRWDYEWFVANGMGEDDLSRLKADWEALTQESAV